jgi:hypothetical protein
MSKRISPFKRAPSVATPQLTERDLDIIRQVHRHRFLRSSHIISLVGGSPQQILRRLKLLYRHGYLERPRSQLNYYHKGGSRHMVYGLGSKSGDVLKEAGVAPAKRRIGEKNRAVEKIFLNHEVFVSDIMVAIDLACRKAGIRIFYGEEMKLPERLRRNKQPFRWRVNVNGTKLTVFPDRVFALESKDRRQAYFFLEADRGTMPVTRKGLSQTSFRRKLLAYEATWNQNIHLTRLGFNRFRVLTVTTSAGRVKSIIEACLQLKSGHGLFLFANRTILDEPDKILLTIWQTGRVGETTTLLE